MSQDALVHTAWAVYRAVLIAAAKTPSQRLWPLQNMLGRCQGSGILHAGCLRACTPVAV